MEVITKETAQKIMELGASYLESYENRNNSQAFYYWISSKFNETALSTYIESSKIDNDLENIENIVDTGQGFVNGKQYDLDVDTLDVSYFNNMYHEQFARKQDIEDNCTLKQFGMFICAKNKIESRGFFSKLFHPIRTYHEYSTLNNLKTEIMENFKVDGDVFDKIIDFVEGKPAYENCDLINKQGGTTGKILTTSAIDEIDDNVKEAKQIDNLLQSNKREMEKGIPDFNEEDVEKNF